MNHISAKWKSCDHLVVTCHFQLLKNSCCNIPSQIECISMFSPSWPGFLCVTLVQLGSHDVTIPGQAVVLDLPLGPAARGGAVGGRAVPVEGVRWRREGRRCGGSKVRGEG